VAFRLWHEDAWTPSYHCVGEYFCEDLFIGLFCGSLVVSCPLHSSLLTFVVPISLRACVCVCVLVCEDLFKRIVCGSVLWLSCHIYTSLLTRVVPIYVCVCMCQR